MANLFTRIFKRRPPALEETTQLSSILTLAGFMQYVAGQQRDLDATARLETSENAYNAFRTNPMAYNYVNVMTNFLFGPGCQFSHSDETANERLRDFIRTEKFGRRLIEMANGYRVEGIRFICAYGNTLTGEVKVREFDPATVQNVVIDKEDYENIVGLYRAYTERVWDEDGRTCRDEQHEEFVKQDEKIGPYTVRHFFVWKRPTVAGETRGWSFLLPVFHYLVQYREYLKTRLNFQRALSMFAWIWRLKGLSGTVADKQAKAAAFQAVLSGSVPAGSQLVTVPGGDNDEGFDIEAITSGVTAGGAGAAADARALGLQVAVGLSAPEGVALGDWSNANYSSLSLSIQTFIKNIQGEQTIWGTEGFLGEFFDWWLGIQRDARLISEEAAGEPVNITWPVIIPYDLNQLTNILKFMREDKEITRRSAAGYTPFDVDYDAERDGLDAEEEEAAARRAKAGLPEPPLSSTPETTPAYAGQPPENKPAAVVAEE